MTAHENRIRLGLALREADNLLARLLSPYAMIWNPVLRRNIKRVRKQIKEALNG